MEAIYKRESNRHAWKLQALKFQDGMALTKELQAQARKDGYNHQYCVAIGPAEFTDWPETFRGRPYLLHYVPEFQEKGS